MGSSKSGRSKVWFTLGCACAVLSLAACEDKEKGKAASAPVKAAGAAPKLDVPNLPPPPIVRSLDVPTPASAPAIPVRVFDGPTAGAESAEALAKGIVDAAKKRDEAAFLALTVSGKDVALHFHPGVQTQLREVIGRLPRKFATYIQQLPTDAALTGVKLGLPVDFKKGQGAITPMPGHLSTTFTVKAGPNARTLPLGRIVQIDGKWKLLDF